jgi:hypothetical protein
MKQQGKISTTRVQYLAIIKKLSDNIKYEHSVVSQFEISTASRHVRFSPSKASNGIAFGERSDMGHAEMRG